MGFIEGADRGQASLLPPSVDDYVAPEALVRVVDTFVGSLELAELAQAAARSRFAQIAAVADRSLAATVLAQPAPKGT
jgi:hypothetical protein